MISILFLILIFIWFYKKRTSYNPYDISLSHSSYYECAFCREEKCTEEVLRILEPVAGHKRILKNVFLQGEKDGRAGADVVMIHESGIYVIHSANLEGVIAVSYTHLSDVMWTMQQILFMSFDKRLAVFLVDEAAKTGEDTLTMTHDQIARYTGSAREVVSRMLKYFEKENLVELARGRVKLANKKKLQELARK